MPRWSPNGSACRSSKIRLTQADTDEVAIGRGTYASRSMMVGGSALRAAADEVIEHGKRFAAHFLEADAADITFAEGKFTIAGTDKAMPLLQVAQMSFIPIGMPAELGVGLHGAGAFARQRAELPQWLPHLRSRDRSRDRGGRCSTAIPWSTISAWSINPLLAPGPDPWRRRPGRGPGARRGHRLRHRRAASS